MLPQNSHVEGSYSQEAGIKLVSRTEWLFGSGSVFNPRLNLRTQEMCASLRGGKFYPCHWKPKPAVVLLQVLHLQLYHNISTSSTEEKRSTRYRSPEIQTPCFHFHLVLQNPCQCRLAQTGVGAQTSLAQNLSHSYLPQKNPCTSDGICPASRTSDTSEMAIKPNKLNTTLNCLTGLVCTVC